ncbi:GNAT family N-acetyltransferase [Streptomyces sp. B1866]|uniref:GNAT family N-acetyltransferase n=1 Tax=Streptomyces sp. B1866 TaxID=3075431 RepID=UPI0028914239|nr:GNAT family N-acetyltransferase [Streptomyces sp. B1866]MDT3396142.1 GNAT family N-acetyltransferase [Streptomyces sp. B1866]
MSDDITIRPALTEEVGVIADMWADASERLKAQGQWQYPADTKKILRDIERGNAYIAHCGADYMGTVTVDDFADPEFWKPADDPQSALYGHRIITSQIAIGRSIGVALIDWASLKAEKAGKDWFRVDAWKTNTQLGDYYERMGFEHIRTVDLPHRRSGALYQRRAGVVTGRAPRFVGLESLSRDANGNPAAEGGWGWTSET